MNNLKKMILAAFQCSMVVFGPSGYAQANTPHDGHEGAGTPKQYCILKADDFGDVIGTKEWDNYVNFINLIKQKGIVAGLGLIGKRCVDPSPEFVSYVQDLEASGKFEFWNHGYDHGWDPRDAEFKGKSFEYQFSKMKQTQDVVKQKLKITMRSFGAPGNHSDSITAQVLDSLKEIKVWMYDNTPAPSGILGLPLRTKIEWLVSDERHPDFERFKKEYDPTNEYLLGQAHPHMWYNKNDLVEFGKIIDFLLSKEVKFILPYDYYLLKQK